MGLRLGITFLVVALMSAVVALTAIIQVRGLADVRQRELNVSVPYVAALQSAALDAKAAATDERGYLISGDKKFREEVDTRWKGIDNSLTEAEKLGNPTQKAQVQKIRTEMTAWITAVRAELELFTTDRTKAVELAFGPNRDLRKTYEGNLNKAINAGMTSISAGEEFQADVRRSQWTVLGLAAAALIVAGLLAWRLTARVLAPIRAQVDGLQNVAHGDLTVRVPERGRDEFTLMASAFNEAMGRLSGALAEVSQTASRVTGSADDLLSKASNGAESASNSATEAADASQQVGEVSESVQTVAAGTEEMTASIREIAKNAQDAAGVAASA
ncbi:CHASE3 domain-containing protein, partial [Austwickia chelonae]